MRYNLSIIPIMLLVSAVLILMSTIPIYAISDENLEWFGGIVYKLTPDDNMVTDKDYTIKAVEFPAPVRGIRTINGTIPERLVVPFVGLEIYKDMVNNSNPIDNFTLGIGDEYITADKDMKITLVSMPGNMSSYWVYEYYNPWANIKIQRRTIPTLIVRFKNDTREDTIDPGDTFKINITIKNIGNDTATNVNYDINIGSLVLKSNTAPMKDTVGNLDKDQQKIIEITLEAPAAVEGREYDIYVNMTAYDSLGTFHSWNASKKINVRSITDSILISKTTENSIYLKENIDVILSITNMGPLYMDNIKIYDFIPEGLLLVKDNVIFKNTTEISFDKYSLGSGESYTYIYMLKPIDPGIYVLPKFRINFSIRGKELNLTSNEKGFRVFGPKVVLDKSVMYKGKDDKKNDIIDVKISAKNVGNGFAARVTIDDQLPENATLVSGDTHILTSLDVDDVKTINYVVSMSGFRGMNLISWPPAMVTYYLDDYKFSTFSEKTTEEIYKDLFRNETINIPINETPKRVVATIPAKTPKPPEKGTGVEFYIIVIGIIGTITILILFRKNIREKIGKIKTINKKSDKI